MPPTNPPTPRAGCASCGKPKDEHVQEGDDLYCYPMNKAMHSLSRVARTNMLAATFVPPASAPAATPDSESHAACAFPCPECDAEFFARPAATPEPMCECGKPFGEHYTDGLKWYCTNPHHWGEDEKPPRFRPTGEEAGHGFHFTEPRRCVECEACGFAFDATHRNDDADGEYSCPHCAEDAQATALAALRARVEWAERNLALAWMELGRVPDPRLESLRSVDVRSVSGETDFRGEDRPLTEAEVRAALAPRQPMLGGAPSTGGTP